MCGRGKSVGLASADGCQQALFRLHVPIIGGAETRRQENPGGNKSIIDNSGEKDDNASAFGTIDEAPQR